MKGFKELIKTLDRIFSEYIRLKNTDSNGNVRCFTCREIHFWKDIDCGHYISRRYYITRLDERNCYPQCRNCNRIARGQRVIYRQGLVDIYGEEEITKMEHLAQYTKSLNCESLRKKIIEYREKLKLLKIEKGL